MRKRVFGLTVPVIIEQSLIIFMGTVNALMAAGLGDNVVSGIGLVDSIFMMIIAVLSALAVGVTVIVAQRIGGGDRDTIIDVTHQGILLGLLSSAILSLLVFVLRWQLLRMLFGNTEQVVLDNANLYMSIALLSPMPLAVVSVINGSYRGAGNTKTPLIITVTMNVVNVAATYFFIYIAGLGIAGAGIGLTAARYTGAVLGIIFFKRQAHIKYRALLKFKLQMEHIRAILSVGIPASVESLLFNTGKLITQTFIASSGTAGLTANYIAGVIFNVLNIPGASFSITATTLVGQAYGRRDFDEAKKVLMYIVRTVMICFAVLALVLFPLSRSAVSLFTKNEEAIEQCLRLVWLTLLAMPTTWAISFILPSGFKGSGDAKYTMVVATATMWLFRVIVAYFLSIHLGLGVFGVWLGMVIDWVARGGIFLARYFSKKWIHIVE